MLCQQRFKALGKAITHLGIAYKPQFTGLRPPIELQIADAIVKHRHFKWAAMLPMAGDAQSLDKDLQSHQASLELHDNEAPDSHASKTMRPCCKARNSHNNAH